MTGRPTLRQARAEDFLAVYGELPFHSVLAWVGEADGVVLGIGGLAFHRGAPSYLFLQLRPECRHFRKSMFRACRNVLSQLRGKPANAIADPDQPGSARFLERLGLRYMGEAGGVKQYRWR